MSLDRARNLLALKKARTGGAGTGDAPIRAASAHAGKVKIPTGSVALDIALNGGIPVGACTMFYGHESSSKTTNMLRVLGEAQKLCANCYRPAKNLRVESMLIDPDGDPDDEFNVHWYAVAECDCYKTERTVVRIQPRPDEVNPKTKSGLAVNPETGRPYYEERLERYGDNSYEEVICALVDIEGTLDRGWATGLGVDVRRLNVSNPTSGEAAVDVYLDLMGSGSVDVICMDSIAVLVPLSEIEEDSSAKQHVGTQAKLVNKLVRKSTVAKNTVGNDYGRPVTEMWTNQFRNTIGAWGDTRVLPGGNGQKFHPSVKIECRMGDFEFDKVELGTADTAQEEASAARCAFKVTKNKVDPRRNGSFRVFLRGPEAGRVDNLDLIEKLGRQFDLIWKDGTKWYCGEESFRTKSELLAWLYGDATAMAALRNEIMRKSREG